MMSMKLARKALRFGWRVARGGTRRVLEACGVVPPLLRYPAWMRERLAARLIEYPLPTRPIPFSIITPVCDPSLRHLRALARSVLDQDYSNFEWVLVNNGCRRRRIRRYLRQLSRRHRVRLIESPQNVGIVAGSRLALHAASGDYVLPVDHDDTIYPDALRVMAHFIDAHEEPAILYSDEDKLVHGRPACPFFKPDWDPALFLNCCYVSHLTAFAREMALELDAYGDPDAEGCPDWDTHARFVRAGHPPVHVPEVLYSWRVHRASTSSIEAGAKVFAVESQGQVLRKHLAEMSPAKATVLRENPLFGHRGMWWVARGPGEEPRLHVNLVTRGEIAAIEQRLRSLAGCRYSPMHVRVVGPLSVRVQRHLNEWAARLEFEQLECSDWRGRYAAWLRETVEAQRPGELIVTIRDDFAPLTTDWPWELVGLLERHEDAVAVCGQFLDAEGKLVQAGEVFGFAGLAGSPVVGPHFAPSGYHGLRFCQRTVSVPTVPFFVARAGFLNSALQQAECVPSGDALGLWLGAHARRTGGRVLYTPHVLCQQEAEAAWPVTCSDEETQTFLRSHQDLLENDPFYGRFFSLAPGEGYLLTSSKQRQTILNGILSRVRLHGSPRWANLEAPVPMEVGA
jgi:hypothetical protein